MATVEHVDNANKQKEENKNHLLAHCPVTPRCPYFDVFCSSTFSCVDFTLDSVLKPTFFFLIN